MIKSKAHSSKNKSSISSGAWAVSLIIQLVALYCASLYLLNYGFIGVVIFVLLATGYLYLVRSTVNVIRGKVTNKDFVSMLTAVHVVTLLPSIVVIAFISSFFNITF